MLSPVGLGAILRAVGWDCSDFDIVNDAIEGQRGGHDLSSDNRWQVLHADLDKGEYDFVLAHPPAGLGPPASPAGSRDPHKEVRRQRLNLWAQTAQFLQRAAGHRVGFALVVGPAPPGADAATSHRAVVDLSALPGAEWISIPEGRALIWGVDAPNTGTLNPRAPGARLGQATARALAKVIVARGRACLPLAGRAALASRLPARA